MRPIYLLLMSTLLLSILTTTLFNYGSQMQLVFTSLLTVAFLIAKQYNIKQTILALIFLTLIEMLLAVTIRNYFPKNPIVYASTFFYFSQLVLDFLAYYFVKNRQVILLYVANHNPKKYKEILLPCVIDGPLLGIFFIFCAFDIFMIAENIIRNLEHFGVPESFAKQFWHWDWVYYASQPTKLGLQALTIMVLFAGIYITRSRAARGEKPLSYDDCTASKP